MFRCQNALPNKRGITTVKNIKEIPVRKVIWFDKVTDKSWRIQQKHGSLLSQHGNIKTGKIPKTMPPNFLGTQPFPWGSLKPSLSITIIYFTILNNIYLYLKNSCKRYLENNYTNNKEVPIFLWQLIWVNLIKFRSTWVNNKPRNPLAHTLRNFTMKMMEKQKPSYLPRNLMKFYRSHQSLNKLGKTV